MFKEQRTFLDELTTKIQYGRISRRTFLEGALQTGLSSSVATSLLSACSKDTKFDIYKKPTIITWQSEHDSIGIYASLVDTFNKTNKAGIHVIYVGGQTDTGQLHASLVEKLQARGGPDILSLDITWPAEFAKNSWTIPIEDRWSASERVRYFQAPIQACTFKDHIWAVPLRTDAGLIYYRKDLVAKPPVTWDEMMSLIMQQPLTRTKIGYVWQGAQYEGLVCNFVEVLHSFGGSVFASDNPNKVTIHTQEAHQALTSMVNWIDTISPANTVSFEEEDSRLLFQNGRAMFMRNWSYAYSLGNDSSTSSIVGKFDVHPMLFGGNSTTGHSCIGGWQLAINAFSPHKNEAWEFIKYMISLEAQKRIAFTAALTTTLIAIYEDHEALTKYPFIESMQTILTNAKPRPTSSRYTDISRAIQSYIHQALMKQRSPADALTDLQEDLERIIKSENKS